MNRIIEILLYTLKPGTGSDFHKIMQEISVPLHKQVGMDVIAFGNSVHTPDNYYLIRAYDSLEHLKVSQDNFYASTAWKTGPRIDIISRIETSIKVVMPLSLDAIKELRQPNF